MRACSAILLSVFACAAWGQEETPVFRATSDLVLLDVQVIHIKTKTATGVLAAKDFVLSEDGAPQQISVFAHEQFPLSIVLLFDLTQSDWGVLRRLAGSAETALRHLGPEDEVAVMAYAASAKLVDGFTTDRQSTVAAIRRAAAMRPNEAAFFNEAVFQAAQQLRQSHNPTSRRASSWSTHNFPNAPSDANLQHDAQSLHGVPPHSEAEAIRALHESGTVVTALLLKDPLAALWAAPMMALEASARKKNPAVMPTSTPRSPAESAPGCAARMWKRASLRPSTTCARATPSATGRARPRPPGTPPRSCSRSSRSAAAPTGVACAGARRLLP